jgi:hypothetical protein
MGISYAARHGQQADCKDSVERTPNVVICMIQSHRSGTRMEGKDLRKAGLKVTLPRLKILEILERSATQHLSAEIYKA